MAKNLHITLKLNNDTFNVMYVLPFIVLSIYFVVFLLFKFLTARWWSMVDRCSFIIHTHLSRCYLWNKTKNILAW